MVKPFKVDISDHIIKDIYDKVKKYPWHEMPKDIPGKDGGWHYGTDLDYMKKISNYWVNKFDWRKQEAKINKYSNFITKVDDIDIHFIQEKGSIAIHKNEIAECNIQKNLKIVDLTGAGDLFAAGFLHGYVNNLSMKESLQKGTEMASKIIQKIGARLN